MAHPARSYETSPSPGTPELRIVQEDAEGQSALGEQFREDHERAARMVEALQRALRNMNEEDAASYAELIAHAGEEVQELGQALELNAVDGDTHQDLMRLTQRLGRIVENAATEGKHFHFDGSDALLFLPDDEPTDADVDVAAFDADAQQAVDTSAPDWADKIDPNEGRQSGAAADKAAVEAALAAAAKQESGEGRVLLEELDARRTIIQQRFDALAAFMPAALKEQGDKLLRSANIARKGGEVPRATQDLNALEDVLNRFEHTELPLRQRAAELARRYGALSVRARASGRLNERATSLLEKWDATVGTFNQRSVEGLSGTLEKLEGMLDRLEARLDARRAEPALSSAVSSDLERTAARAQELQRTNEAVERERQSRIEVITARFFGVYERAQTSGRLSADDRQRLDEWRNRVDALATVSNPAVQDRFLSELEKLTVLLESRLSSPVDARLNAQLVHSTADTRANAARTRAEQNAAYSRRLTPEAQANAAAVAQANGIAAEQARANAYRSVQEAANVPLHKEDEALYAQHMQNAQALDAMRGTLRSPIARQAAAREGLKQVYKAEALLTKKPEVAAKVLEQHADQKGDVRPFLVWLNSEPRRAISNQKKAEELRQFIERHFRIHIDPVSNKPDGNKSVALAQTLRTNSADYVAAMTALNALEPEKAAMQPKTGFFKKIGNFLRGR